MQENKTDHARSRLGALVARVVAGAWREGVPPAELSPAELQEVTPLLLETGAGALGWRRIRGTESAQTREGKMLQQAYRLHTLQVAVHEMEIVEAFNCLRQAGIEPLLAKGWAIGRLYPEKGLRPFGDIDLRVPRGQERRAQAVLWAKGVPTLPVDLEPDFPYRDDHPLDEQYARSQVFSLHGCDVRVLGPEDQLRFLCLYMLAHGAWRPFWLCDVGVMVENLPAAFDWDYFLSGDRRRTQWVLCTLGLAHRLTGATLGGTLVTRAPNRVPPWLEREVVYCLGQGHPPYEKAMLSTLMERKGVLGALRERWPSPIKAGLRWRSPWSRLPKWPLQAGDYVVRGAAFAWRLRRGIAGVSE